MSKGLTIGLGVIAAAALFLLWNSVFTVPQWKQALVLQFGKPVQVIIEPGLHFKLPIIQDVALFDRRVLEFDAAAKAWLSDAGYDPAYGARPLKRVVQRVLQNPIASLILEGRVADGDTVRIGASAGGLVSNGETVSAAAA